MRGPLSWFIDIEHYFLHHDCTGVGNNGEPYWMTWYDIRDKNENWCKRCDSKPSESIIGLFTAMEYL